MTRGRPQVVASDCDGTLLRSDGSVSPRTREVLAALEADGVAVVLVTARPPRWMDELADVVGGHGVALCGNGAFTYEVASRRVTAHRLIDAGVVAELLADLRRELPDARLATEGLSGFAREPGFFRASGRVDGEFLVGTLAEIGAHAAGKVLVRHEGLELDELRATVAQVVGQRAEVSHSGTPGLAEIAAAGVSKGLALADWCGERGVHSSDVWAFGDMPNDIPMLARVGHAVAVGNAHADVLAVADEVTATNDEDGVAVVLERLLA